jgi:hypothetical protein
VLLRAHDARSGRAAFNSVCADIERAMRQEVIAIVMAPLNKEAVPPKLAIVIGTWPKTKQGSGFPTCVFAILTEKRTHNGELHE